MWVERSLDAAHDLYGEWPQGHFQVFTAADVMVAMPPPVPQYAPFVEVPRVYLSPAAGGGLATPVSSVGYIDADEATYYDHPIAVLQGPHAASAGDIFPYFMRNHPRARRFGLPLTMAGMTDASTTRSD